MKPRQQPIGITIPDDITIADLKLVRTADGDLEFDWAPIDRICEASGIDPRLFSHSDEGNVASLLNAWYRKHLQAGGAPDPVFADLIGEAEAEDAAGQPYSHAPGRA